MKILVILLPLFYYAYINKTAGTEIIRFNVPPYFDTGEFGQWEYCDKDQYVVAAQVKTYKSRGLSGVCLYCADIGKGYNEKTSKKICSLQGPKGFMNDVHSCDLLMNGFNTISDKAAQRYTKAIQNLIFMCSGNKNIFGEGLDKPAQPEFQQKCLKGQAFCGLRTKVDKITNELTNIQMKCCDIKSSASTCTAKDAWEEVANCNNLSGSAPRDCTLILKIGTNMKNMSSLTKEEAQAFAASVSVEASASVGLDIASASLSARFSTGKGFSSGTVWSTEKENTFSEETELTLTLDVKPKQQSRLYQVIGSCGTFEVRARRFYRVDTAVGKQVIPPTTYPPGFFCDKMGKSTDKHSNIVEMPPTNKPKS